MGQPGASAPPDDGTEAPTNEPPNGPARGSPGLVIVGFMLGNLLLQVFDVPAWPWWVRAALGVLGVAVLAAIRFGLPSGFPGAGSIRRLWRWLVRRRLAALVSVGVAVLLGLLAPNLLDRFEAARFAIWGCPHPTELRVLTAPDGFDGVRQLADRYEQHSAGANHGCAAVSVYVFTSAPQELAQALAGSWPEDALRELGPRPDVWLSETGTQVDEAKRANPDLIAEDYLVASSPLVLATADPELAAEVRGRRTTTWAETLDRASRADRSVVRPDPTASMTGRMATALLYGGASPADPTRARSVEQLIGRSLDRDAYPLGDALDLLCRRRQLPKATGSVIVSEQAVLWFNSGAPLGEHCAAGATRRAAADRLQAFYPSDTRGLEVRFARLGWNDAGQARAATRFGDWLTSDVGKSALLAAGLRPSGVHASEPISEQNGLLPGAAVSNEPVSTEALRSTMQLYDLAHRRGRVLLALDASGSMGAAAAGGRTRFAVAGDGVRRALELMGPRDEIGLWFFSGGPGGTPVQQAVPIGPRDGSVGTAPRRDAALVALGQTTPAGGTPLLRAVRDGVTAVGPGTDDTVSALVVLTDGEDTTSGMTLADVRATATAHPVRIFAIAVGETRCAAEALRVLSTDSGGACYDADSASVGARLADVVAALWGKVGG